MSPTEQAILTLVCMLGAWVWGMRQGREQGLIEGIGNTVDTLHQMGIITLDDEEEVELDLGDDIKVRMKKDDDE
jgi:hypothetical protein